MFTLDVDDKLKLALIEPSFAPLYLDIVTAQRDYLSQWLAWPPHAHDEAFFLTFIKRSLHEYADGSSLVCAMMFDDQLVGNISFNRIDHERKRVEIGYWINADFQGKGIVSKSATKMIDLAFNQYGMEKVQISAAVDNQPSRKLCERLGLKLEGIITHNENLNGRIVDHAIYGIHKAQWSKS